MTVKLGLVCVGLCLGLVACGDDASDPDDGGTGIELDTGATCPPGSDLTYENFARAFFAEYCTHCHGSTLAGEARNGAPADVNLDSLMGVKDVGPVRIDRWAGAGPEGVRTVMPLGQSNPQPTSAERHDLSEWLACGSP